MIVELRPYQSDLEFKILRSWQEGIKNILAVLPTGGGKTVIFAKVLRDHIGASCAIAHRQELVGQISLALARFGVRHRIIGRTKIIKRIVAKHIKETGHSYYDPAAQCAVAGVDTLIRRRKQLANWLPQVTKWVTDEAHHILKNNKWGKAVDMFPNAVGLGVTATPIRADGCGLGRSYDGVFDVLVEGPTMRQLIDAGYLTDYRVYSPTSNINMASADVSSVTGDWNQNQVRDIVAKSSLVVSDDKARVVGDIVSFYQNNLMGKLTVTFVPDVATAHVIADQFNAVGIPAIALSAKTPDDERAAAIDKFERREIWQLINVDLFSEGFDLPAIEAVQDGYPTQSFSRFAQRFGRMLRLMKDKLFGIYVDHADNIGVVNGRHGLPDAPRQWTLARRDKRAKGENDAPQHRKCDECSGTFDRYKRICPYCETPVKAPEARNGPEFVDGDLFELDAATLAELRGGVAVIDEPLQDAIARYRHELQAKYTPKKWEMGHVKRFAEKHEKRKHAISGLREIMAWWAGHLRADGKTDSEIFRIFYIKFGVDWLTAQMLETNDALKLADKVARCLI